MNSLSRRNFLKLAAGGGLAAACAGTLYTGLDTQDLVLERTTVRVPLLPRSFEGYRIGFLTDTHIGSCNTAEVTEAAMQMLALEKPDILCLGGDYIVMPDYLMDQGLVSLRSGQNCFRRGKGYHADLSLAEEIYETIASILSSFRPLDGAVGVYGNHDKWVSPAGCKKHLEKRSIRLLVNETFTVQRGQDKLNIVGVDDYWSGVPRLPQGIARKPGNESWIVISHNPDYVSKVLKHGLFHFDLALCGHTHGGQIRLPVIGAIYYNVLDRKFAMGLASANNSSVYTSRGIGVVGIPIRLNCPPEVSLITLKST